jgi:neuropeptide Y receptor
MNLSAVVDNNYNSTLVEDHSKVTIAIIGTLYGLISLIGISGNCLVVYVVCVKKSMQSVTNLFIMNLALSDILMCLLAVPFTPISFFQENWPLGKFLCHLIPFSLGVSVYVSTLTSLAIAIDRYFVIVHPFKPRMKLGVCLLLIAVVWIVSISISLPLAIYVELADSEKQENGDIKRRCRVSTFLCSILLTSI